MLIRISGGNSGISEYLENGKKQGREFSRNEIDKRLILDGDLLLTRKIIDSIENKGQERYIHITLSFHENDISHKDLQNITREYKELLLNAYHEDEYNFYAEAHLPKVKYITDNNTGEKIERKPHIHIIIPEINLITNKVLNPRGRGELYIKEFDAIQEYINNKYHLVSPKDGLRVSDQNHANVLSRHKGDLFREAESKVKTEIFSKIQSENINNEEQFTELLKQYGKVKVYNKGKENKYYGVKLEGNNKFTRLKSPLFSQQYIINRRIPLIKLTQKQIESRIADWKERISHEIKHINPSGEKNRKHYASLNDEHKRNYLNKVIKNYGEKNNIQRQERWTNSYQSSVKRDTRRNVPSKSIGLSCLPERILVYGLNGRSERLRSSQFKLLLQANEYNNLSTIGRKKLDSNQHLRWLQNRAEHGRPARSIIENGINDVLKSDDDLPLMRKVRLELEPTRFLSYLHTHFNIDPVQHTVTFAKDGSPRFNVEKRNYNVGDFLTKYLNLEWNEAKKILLDVWEQQNKNTTFINVKPYVKLTKEQARERFLDLNNHKQLVSSEIKEDFNGLNKRYNQEIKALSLISDKKEREVEKGFLVFKKLLETENIILKQRLCMNEIQAHYNHWQPNNQRGNNMLGESLKKILKRSPLDNENFISSYEPLSVSDKVKKTLHIDEYVKIELKDLLAHKVNPKEIRYLDPKTTETVFMDKGDRISSHGGVTQDKSEIMLMYAKEKYGGVLRLSGTEEFKTSCAMACAEKGLNIIFKPEKYHEMMLNRQAELQAKNQNQQNMIIEKENLTKSEPEPEKTATQEKPDTEKLKSAVENSLKPSQLKEAIAQIMKPQLQSAHELKDAHNSNKSEKETSVLEIKNPTATDKISVTSDQIKAFTVTEDQDNKPMRTLDKELDRLADSYCKDLGVRKEDAIEAIGYFNIESLEILDKRINDPERVQAMKQAVKEIHEWNEQIRQRESTHAKEIDNDYSR
ncbi:MAG TPA: LPD7 domain-containing protein [Arsenophonus nasoniae]|uniref:LPD7 domain-containing protein n=1 Tax=Arsenophonus nasoniae TaxID=638 RepID=UPI00387A2D9C